MKDEMAKEVPDCPLVEVADVAKNGKISSASDDVNVY